ncbi:MAG: Inosose dehydratase [Phycisphaerae bacterium]|nr:Inosose dehydratase [Phycisphaerae bacterium]
MASSKTRIPVGLQMYTLRDDCRADFPGTLAKVARIGYAGVELAGTYGLSPQQLADLLKKLNLKAVSNHTGLDAIRDKADEVIALHKAVGATRVVLPWLDEKYHTADGFKTVGRTLADAARRFADAGLGLAYHNHAFEFRKFDGRDGYDILLEAAGEKVTAELDVYWAKFAGHDPVEMIRRLGRRCELLHLKDMTAGAEPTFAEVGHGVIDFAPIFKAADEVGVKWYIVEQDRCPQRPPLEAVRMSFDSLKKWGKA